MTRLLARALTVAALVPALAVAQEVRPAVPPSSQLEVLGHADFQWEIEDLDGTETNLGAFEGRVIFLNFWASWCKPCVAEMASIQQLAARLHDSDVAFLLISPEGERSVRRFVRKQGLSVPVYLERQDAPPEFGVVGLPTTLIIDREGRIVLRHYGAADWDKGDVAAFLRAL